jgi:hypothetical protein
MGRYPVLRWFTWKRALYIFVPIVALYAGLIVGYVLMGDRPLVEIFQLHTWTHLLDLIFAN